MRHDPERIAAAITLQAPVRIPISDDELAQILAEEAWLTRMNDRNDPEYDDD